MGLVMATTSIYRSCWHRLLSIPVGIWGGVIIHGGKEMGMEWRRRRRRRKPKQLLDDGRSLWLRHVKGSVVVLVLVPLLLEELLLMNEMGRRRLLRKRMRLEAVLLCGELRVWTRLDDDHGVDVRYEVRN